MDRRIKRKLEILSIIIVVSHNYDAILAHSKPNQVNSDITSSH